jgi:hypothetical protein
MDLPGLAAGDGESAVEARMQLETYEDKWKLGKVPVLDDMGLQALNTYGIFHNQRTHDFPMAYMTLWEGVEIEIDGPEWVQFFEMSWIRINATVNAVRHEKERRERENS